MNVERWTTLNRLLDEALELRPAERGHWVERLGPEHETLRRRLRQILACDSADHAGDADPSASDASDGFAATLPKFTVLPSVADADEMDPASAPKAIGPYRIVRKLGEGGMGAVWLAHRVDGMVRRLSRSNCRA